MRPAPQVHGPDGWPTGGNSGAVQRNNRPGRRKRRGAAGSNETPIPNSWASSPAPNTWASSAWISRNNRGGWSALPKAANGEGWFTVYICAPLLGACWAAQCIGSVCSGPRPRSAWPPRPATNAVIYDDSRGICSTGEQISRRCLQRARIFGGRVANPSHFGCGQPPSQEVTSLCQAETFRHVPTVSILGEWRWSFGRLLGE